MQQRKTLQIHPELAPIEIALIHSFVGQLKKQNKYEKLMQTEDEEECISLLLNSNCRCRALDLGDLRTGARLLIGYDITEQPAITHVTWKQLINLIKE